MENPFALSLCGQYVVERHPGEVYPTVMAVAEAQERRARCVRDAARYAFEGEDGMAAMSQGIANNLFAVLPSLSVGRLAA